MDYTAGSKGHYRGGKFDIPENAISSGMNAFFIPENLNLAALTSFVQKRNHQKSYVDRMLFIISTITTNQIESKTSASAFVPLHAKTLMHYVGKKSFSKVMKDLKELEIVEVNGNYRFGSAGYGWCKSYRLTEKYRTRFVEVPTTFAEGKSRYKFAKPKQDEQLTEKDFTEEHLYLKKLHDSIELADEPIDLSGEKDTDSYNQRLYAINKIKRGDLFFSVGSQSGRVTNSVTNFPKEQRKQLRLHGKPMLNIDISNCHPLLLVTLYRFPSLEKEVFQKVVEKGQFYDVLCKQLKAKYSSLPPEKIAAKMERCTVNEVKKKYVQFANASLDDLAKWEHTLIKDIEAVMSELFPELSAEIRKAKKRASLAVVLQKKESALIVGAVIGSLRKRGIAALTVHDSLMCFQEDADLVARVIQSCCRKLYNLSPHLKVNGHPYVVSNEPLPPEPEDVDLDKILENLDSEIEQSENESLEILLQGLENHAA